jgi:hypothetical protein
MTRLTLLLLLLCPAFAHAEAPSPRRQPSGLKLLDSPALELRRLAQLHERIETLELSRPSLVWPTFLTVLGVGGEAEVLVLALSSSWLGAALVVIAGIAAVPLIIGVIFLVANVVRNAQLDRQVATLRETQLELLRF